MQNKASPRLLRLSFHPKDELGIPEGLLGSFSIFVVFTVTENIPTQIPSTKTHYGKECICQRITDILDQTGAHWSKTQSRRNICKGRKILVWHNLPASRWKLKTVCNISLRLNPISREAPDAGGGGSSKEVSTQWKPSEVCSAIKAGYQLRAATFPPGEADSPSLLEVARAAGRRSARQRQPLSQGAGMAGPRVRPPPRGLHAPRRRRRVPLCAPLCLPFPWSGGFIDSSTWLSPDRKRARVSGCDSPVNKEDPALRRQTNTQGALGAAAALPPPRGPPPPPPELHTWPGPRVWRGGCGPGILRQERARSPQPASSPGVVRRPRHRGSQLPACPFLKPGAPGSRARTQKPGGSPDRLWSERLQGRQASPRVQTAALRHPTCSNTSFLPSPSPGWTEGFCAGTP